MQKLHIMRSGAKDQSLLWRLRITLDPCICCTSLKNRDRKERQNPCKSCTMCSAIPVNSIAWI